MPKRLPIHITFLLAGWTFGLLDSRIPMPHASGVFWAGNLGAPWVVLPFLAGWAAPSRRRALVAGALTCVAAMVGFFGPGSGWGPAPVAFVAGWITVGALAGGLYGRFGFTWGRSRALLEGLGLRSAVPRRATGLVMGPRLLAGSPAHVVCGAGRRPWTLHVGGRRESPARVRVVPAAQATRADHPTLGSLGQR